MYNFTLNRRIAGSLLAVFLLTAQFSAIAQQQPTLKPLTPLADKKGKKVVAELTSLAQEYEAHKSQKNGRQEAFVPSNKLIQLRKGGYVVIDAVAEADALTLKKDLEAIGAKQTVAFGRVVSAQLPIERIGDLKKLTSMRFVRPAYKPATNVGFTTSQGDKSIRADVARKQFGLSGKGLTIGVLSDSYNNLTGAKTGTLSGDLPGEGNPNGYAEPINVLADLEGGGTDEGRAMLEIVHDVAPGASLSFHTAFNGEADFAQGILDLQKAGADLIVDDVFYYFEPYFQDGVIAQAVDQVAKKGTAYFSSAGNNARNSYENPFQPSGVGVVAGEAHNFAEGDPFQRIFIPSGAEVIFIMQWADPSFSVSGGKGAQTDLDLYLVNDSLTSLVAESAFGNVGNDPVEGFIFTNEGPDGYFNLLIEKFEGPNPELLKVIGYGSFAFTEHNTRSGTSVGHKNTEGAIAVGAARYDRTPAFGVAVPVIEGFSSAGGTPILFDKFGNKISPVVLQKPEIVAGDGANTSFFNPFADPGADYEGDGFPNFFGTSASAPHATAAAALILEATKKSLKPGQLREVLQETAEDMDDPLTPEFDEGFDFRTGYGLIQTDKAVQKAIEAQTVSRLVLVNADNGKDIREIKEGDVLNLSALPEKLNIVAITSPSKIGSVVFSFNGKVATENNLPYALGGDANGTPYRYNALDPALAVGDYTLSATPYTARNGGGKAGLRLSVSFKVVESAVTSFILVNAENAQDLGKIEDGTVINLAALPTDQLNIRAITNPGKVGSVVFDYNGIHVTESSYPYALGGDFNVFPNRFRALADSLILPGNYILSATSYPERDGEGTAGATLLVRFSFVNDTTALDTPPVVASNGSNLSQPGTSAAMPETELAAREFKVFPNPSGGRFTVRTSSNATIHLYDTKGSLVYTGKSGSTDSPVDISRLPNGLYLMRVDEGTGSRTVRVVKR